MNYIEPPRQYLKRHRAMPRCAAVESNVHGGAQAGCTFDPPRRLQAHRPALENPC